MYEIENLRMLELGKGGRLKWYNHPDRLQNMWNPEEQDRYAGMWARAIFLGKTSEDTPYHTSYGFNARLIDYGREVCVHRYFARRAVWRFMPFPAFSTKFILMIHGRLLLLSSSRAVRHSSIYGIMHLSSRFNSVLCLGAVQCTPALHNKWKTILRTDTIVSLKLVVDLGDVGLVVDLASPTENQVRC